MASGLILPATVWTLPVSSDVALTDAGVNRSRSLRTSF